MKDLLGDEFEVVDEVATYLREMDAETLDARASNLSYIISIAPESASLCLMNPFLYLPKRATLL